MGDDDKDFWEYTPLDNKISNAAAISGLVGFAGGVTSFGSVFIDNNNPVKIPIAALSSTAWATGLTLALYLRNLMKSGEYKKYTKSAPEFFALNELEQRAGIEALARDLQSGAISPPLDASAPPIEKALDDTVVNLLEDYAADPARVAVETVAYVKRAEGRGLTR